MTSQKREKSGCSVQLRCVERAYGDGGAEKGRAMEQLRSYSSKSQTATSDAEPFDILQRRCGRRNNLIKNGSGCGGGGETMATCRDAEQSRDTLTVGASGTRNNINCAQSRN